MAKKKVAVAKSPKGKAVAAKSPKGKAVAMKGKPMRPMVPPRKMPPMPTGKGAPMSLPGDTDMDMM